MGRTAEVERVSAVELLVPPYLRSLGYAELPEFAELAKRAVIVGTDQITYVSAWAGWRGILDYVCCVELARSEIALLPKGQQIGSRDVVPARYHSAALVFFAQATLDNLAVWASNRLQLPVRGSDCSFHKQKLSMALVAAVPGLGAPLQAGSAYVARLESYRQEWIHRLSGGAEIYTDKPPSEPDATVQIVVPINPSIGHRGMDSRSLLRAIARTQTNNGGAWLLPIDRFADEMTDGLRSFLVDFLAAALKESKFGA